MPSSRTKTKTAAASEHEWLSLMDISGPFLAPPVLNEAFPQGLDELATGKRRTLRQAYDEWREAQELDDPQLPALHRAWIELVLAQGLEFDEDGSGELLRSGSRLSEALRYHRAEYGVTLVPDYALIDDPRAGSETGTESRSETSSETGRPMLLIDVYAPDVDLEGAIAGDGWAASPAERMVQLCRATNTRLGLVTNGECWMLIDAPVGAVTTFAAWYARLWAQEPVSLQAFVSLLGIRRFFDARERQLPALLDQSLKHQDEVTDALGEQVRRAVEVLIQALDRADFDRDRELLAGIAPTEIYEAGLTVMMRLVFLLSAEERGLLLLGDERYEANYAISTLRMQLRAESEEILERRWDAWSRLLAMFRAVHGGIAHDSLSLPALGGSLFDPDRFPFLEGRASHSQWRTDAATPLPIDNRTVLLLLDAIQLFQGRTLSYRALDVENIGYVYEGLLERTVERAREVTLELAATKSAKQPWLTLSELTAAEAQGHDDIVKLFKARTGSTVSRVRKALEKRADAEQTDRLFTACHNDQALCDQVAPYLTLLKIDRWGYPQVYPKGTFMVTTGSGRRETGTHYTPKSLTEAIARETLEPVVYHGPAQGEPRQDWRLKTPAELLDLKICDPAMGSGAFLVQVCRWLGERLVEAWQRAEASGQAFGSDGGILEHGADGEPMPSDYEERSLLARRLVAERCLYGVDINPMAVELAKLSIWLVTLSAGRPFGFLDHSLRAGDSLLGIHDLDQLRYLKMWPGRKGSGRKLFAADIDQAVDEAVALRKRLRTRAIRDIRDVEAMDELNREAQERIEPLKVIADALFGESLAAGTKGMDSAALAIDAGAVVAGDVAAIDRLRTTAKVRLATDLPAGTRQRRPLHWPLVFPEVFGRQGGGFDAIVGNPPFLGGQRITGVMGTAYRHYLVRCLAAGVKGSADLVGYFFLRAYELLGAGGGFGLLAVNTIAEGDTRQVGLERLIGELGAVIYAAYPNEPWPGKAAVMTSRIHVRKGNWKALASLSGKDVPHISAFLSDREEWSPRRLVDNKEQAFIGSYVLGKGFILCEDDAMAMIERDSKNKDVLFPYLNGKDLNTHPEQKASRWVINFWDWPEEKAKEYEEPYDIVLKKVKPERSRNKRKARRWRWWQFAESAPGLYHAIGRGHVFNKHPANFRLASGGDNYVIACSLVSKYLAFAIVPSDLVFAHRLCVTRFDDSSMFSIMVSEIYNVWARKNSSSLESRLNYSPSDAFETFPFLLRLERVSLVSLGEKYNQCCRIAMQEGRYGLTTLYNMINDDCVNDSKVLELRELRQDIDRQVADAYGWSDVDLNYGFHQVSYLSENDNLRFTISEQARSEILHRLSDLNKECFIFEHESGLHG